jgi:hypothetical protein
MLIKGLGEFMLTFQAYEKIRHAGGWCIHRSSRTESLLNKWLNYAIKGLLRGLEPNHGKFLKDGRSCLALGEPSSC